MRRTLSRRDPTRRGAAVVELAVVLPLMMFLFVIAVDYCRLFYFSQIVTNCARNGAMYASDPVNAGYSGYADIEAAAKADASDPVRSQLVVTSATDSDTYGDYCDVTVEYPFRTITNYPGIPSEVKLKHTVRCRVAPAVPD